MALQAERARPLTDPAPLRVGVVGTAHWARRTHLPGLMATPGVRVAGVWGRTTQATQAVAAQHGVAAFDRYADLLAAVDAVSFAVPPDVQADLAVQAARAGKHLLLEKPVAQDAAAAQALADAVQQAGVAALVFLVRRFVPAIATALDAAALQSWTRAEVRVHSAALADGSPYAGSVWRQQPGAALWDIGPHALSLLIPVLGRVTAVQAWPEAGGIGRMRSWHDGGGQAELSVSLRCAPDQASDWYRFQSSDQDLLLPGPAYDRPAVFGLAAQRLLDMVRTGRREDPCDLRLGIEIVRILDAADRSARTGEVIDLPVSAASA